MPMAKRGLQLGSPWGIRKLGFYVPVGATWIPAQPWEGAPSLCSGLRAGLEVVHGQYEPSARMLPGHPLIHPLALPVHAPSFLSPIQPHLKHPSYPGTVPHPGAVSMNPANHSLLWWIDVFTSRSEATAPRGRIGPENTLTSVQLQVTQYVCDHTSSDQSTFLSHFMPGRRH